MSAEILGADEVFQRKTRERQRDQPERVVLLYSGELSKLQAIEAGFADRAESSKIDEFTGPMPTLEVTLSEYPGADVPTQDAAAVAAAMWELFSYESAIPLRQDAYYAVTAGSEEESDLNIVDDFFDRGVRDVARNVSFLLTTGDLNPLQTDLGKEYAADRAGGLNTVPAFSYEIRNTIFAARETALKASFANVRQINTPPVPSSARFAIDALGGNWLKMSPQATSTGRGRYRLVQAWRHGNWPTKIFGAAP